MIVDLVETQDFGSSTGGALIFIKGYPSRNEPGPGKSKSQALDKEVERTIIDC